MSIPLLPRPHCQKVLPTIYDDALSYYEEVCKLIKVVNEVIETFNSYEQTIIELSQMISDIDGIKSNVTTLQNELKEVTNIISDIDNRYIALQQVDSNLQKQIDELVTKVNNIITSYNNVFDYIDNAIAKVNVENSIAWIRLENYINTQDRMLQLQIDELYKLVQELGAKVYNPVRGVRENLDNNNWDIYQDLRYGGFTNAELSEFGISNDHVASLVHNNRDYALNAKRRFKRHYLFSPVTGKEVSHANAISQAIVSVIGSITNNAFVITTNEILRSYMATNELTNDDIGTLFTNNFERYTLSV